MVADVELQFHAAALLHHRADTVVLVFVEQDIGRRGQTVERNASTYHIRVVQRGDGHRGRTDETQRAGLDHLVVERSCGIPIFHLLAILARMLAVVFVGLLVVVQNLVPVLRRRLAMRQREASALAVDEHPRPAQRAFHAGELLPRARLDHRVAALQPARA